MPSINFHDSRLNRRYPFDSAEESARGSRYLAVAIAVGLSVWLAMAVVVAAWTT